METRYWWGRGGGVLGKNIRKVGDNEIKKLDKDTRI